MYYEYIVHNDNNNNNTVHNSNNTVHNIYNDTVYKNNNKSQKDKQ